METCGKCRYWIKQDGQPKDSKIARCILFPPEVIALPVAVDKNGAEITSALQGAAVGMLPVAKMYWRVTGEHEGCAQHVPKVTN